MYLRGQTFMLYLSYVVSSSILRRNDSQVNRL